MKLSLIFLSIALCLSYASAYNSINEEILAVGKKVLTGRRGPRHVSLNSTFLLVAEIYQISQISLDTPPNRQSLKSNAPYTGSVDYHAKRNRFYWSEITTGRINARNLTGGHSYEDELFIELSPTEWRPRGVAIDYVNDNMYVLDTEGKKVHVIDLETKLRTVIYQGDFKQPTDIVVDSNEGVMFIADHNKILRFNMDGSEMKAIISHPRHHIRAVTLDTVNKRIFWSDLRFHRIKTATYDGTDISIIIKNDDDQRSNFNILGPAFLSYFDGILYFSDEDYRTISSIEVDKYEGPKSGSKKRVYDQIDVRSVKVVNPRKQSKVGKNPCDDADCEQLCLIAKKVNGKLQSKCACNVGKTLADDGKRCL